MSSSDQASRSHGKSWSGVHRVYVRAAISGQTPRARTAYVGLE